jgi:hypothetical protein
LKKPQRVVEEPLKLNEDLEDALSVDTSIFEEDRRPLSPLRTLTSTMKDKRFDTASIAPSMMSLSKQEAIQTLADAAARKLHNDDLLQKAERSRTKHLSALRSSISRTKNGGNIPVGTVRVCKAVLRQEWLKNHHLRNLRKTQTLCQEKNLQVLDARSVIFSRMCLPCAG